jgi:transposase, IS30 family
MLDWSPEQTSGWLKIQYPDDESMRVSHEAIYRSLFISSASSAEKRTAGVTCDPSAAYAARSTLRIFRGRPAEIKARAIPGHWEGI